MTNNLYDLYRYFTWPNKKNAKKSNTTLQTISLQPVYLTLRSPFKKTQRESDVLFNYKPSPFTCYLFCALGFQDGHYSLRRYPFEFVYLVYLKFLFAMK